MANKFTIVINATDQATKVVRGVKNSISSIVRPISNLHKSVASFRKEIGIDKLGKGFATIGKKGVEMASKLGVMTGPMAALGGATTIAGIAALASEWGRLGIEVSNTSANIGIASSDLINMQGAAQLAGAESGSMATGLKSLGDTMQNALYGRNQQALVLLNKLRIGIHKTADGSIDSKRAFLDLADAIASHKSAEVQGEIARQFGMEGLLPLLRKGKVGVEEYLRKVQELNPVTEAQTQAASNFGISQRYLGIALTGVGNTIQQSLIPVIQPMIEGLTNWISKNRKLVSVGIEVGSTFAVVAGIVAAASIPILGIGLAIGVAAVAIGAGAAYIYKNWDGISGFFKKKFDIVKSVILGFMQWVKSVLPPGLADFLGVNSVVSSMQAHGSTSTKSSAMSSVFRSGSAPPAIPLSTIQKQANIASITATAGSPEQKLHVELDVKGLPHGSSARAKTGMGKYLPTRVNYSMPTYVPG